MDYSIYLKETAMLDFSHSSIQNLPQWNEWNALETKDRIGAIHEFVRNDIKFGYNESDLIPASQVLRDGYGQCNTKATLLMALLRKAGIPSRFHAFTIHKELQAGAIPAFLYRVAPDEIIHSWVEALVDGQWLKLEGIILDQPYLDAIQKRFSGVVGPFKGYAIATENLQNPSAAWRGEDTYIQKEGIAQDLGIFENTDAFYRQNGGNLSGVKRVAYKYFLRHLINRNIKRLRQGY